MSDLELSVMAHSPTTEQDLQPILAKFEAQHHVAVKVRVFSWETGWTELVKFALYGHGPDVSEIGSTWVSTLAATNALHPFGLREIAAVGGRYAFLHPSWQSCYLTGESEMWAVPWLANVRLVFYHADRLQQAGYGEPVLVRLTEQFERVLAQLQQAGEAVPLTLATQNTVNSLHNVAMWIWGAGGHFIGPAGKEIKFNEPAARTGLRAYFGLHRFIARAAQDLNDQESDRMFLQGRAALTISDPGLLHTAASSKVGPGMTSQIRTALPPGVPFVGGSNLVIWRHSRQEKLAFELVKYLTSQTTQTAYSTYARSLPVRLDALSSPPFSTDPLYKAIVEALKSGRSYQVNRLWGMVEERLVAELNQIWSELFADPGIDLDALLDQHLQPLAERLNDVLSSAAQK
ncbi:MAG TPA: extracellular solute-binding protein [Anaerolineae bacterium]|nr:extracellular solute-binding protein [Anaerolineae bacterium]